MKFFLQVVLFTIFSSAIIAQNPVAVTNVQGSCPFPYCGGGAPGFYIVPYVGDGTQKVVIGNTIYFVAYESEHGQALWKYNTTTREYALVKDPYPGLNSDIAQITNLVATGNAVYFTATANIQSGIYDIYMTDVTTMGTTLLFASNGTENSGAALRVAGNYVYFMTINGPNQYLYSINGNTVSQLKQVSSDYAPLVSIDTYTSASYGGYLFFMGFDHGSGRELWRSDGTPGGTQLFANLASDSPFSRNASAFADFVEVNSQLFFTGVIITWGIDDASGTPHEIIHKGLFKMTSPSSAPALFYDYDETDQTEGSHIQANFYSYVQKNGPAVLNGAVYFLGSRVAGNAGVSSGLARTDGTTAGTYFVQEFTDGTTSMSVELSRFKDKIIFRKEEGSNPSLWLTDGTVSGTYKIGDKFVNSSNIGKFFTRGNRMFASGYYDGITHVGNSAVWSTDGTNEGTVILTPDCYNTGRQDIFEKIGDSIYFQGQFNGCVNNFQLNKFTIPTKIWLGKNSTDWNDGANWDPVGVPTGIDDIIIPGDITNYPVIASNAIARNLWINWGSVNVASGVQLTVNGELSVVGNLTGDGSLVMAAAGNDNLHGQGTIDIASVIINGSDVTLKGNKEIKQLQFLSNNKIFLGDNNLVVTSNSNAISGFNENRFVVTNGTGTVTLKNIDEAGKTFPVGISSTSYNPVTISKGTGDDFSVKVQPQFSNPVNDSAKVVNAEWMITKAGTTGTDSVTLTPGWNAANEAGYPSPTFNRNSTLVLGHYNSFSALWEEIPAGAVTGNGLYTTTITGVSSFSSFAVGNPGGFVTSASPPTITSFTPENGYTGSSVSITGTGFIGVSGVTIGGVNVTSFIVNDDSHITAVVGENVTGPVSVISISGAGASNTNFTYEGYTTVAYGRWTDGVTWLGGNVPSEGADKTLNHQVTINSPVTNTGTIIANSYFDFYSTFTNSGTVKINTALQMGDGGVFINNGTLSYSANASLGYYNLNPRITGDEFPAVAGPTDLIISNLAGVTLHAPRTIAGRLMLMANVFNNSSNNITLGDGATIERSNGSISNVPIFGNSVNLTYLFGSQVILTGPELPVAPTVLNNFSIRTASGVTLTHDATVNGNMSLSSGIINTGSYKVITQPNVDISEYSSLSYINGKLQRNIPSGTSNITFHIGDATNYRPVTIDFTGVTVAGNLTVSVSSAAGDHPNINTSNLVPAKSVNRYWTFSNEGITGGLYDATFEFVSGDVDAGANTSNFRIGKYSNGAWTYPATTAVDATHTKAIGINDFGDFAIAEPLCIVPVTWYQDIDNDGFGDIAIKQMSCEQPTGFVSDSTDCNDNNASVWRSERLYFDFDRDGYTQGSTIICYGATIPFGFVLAENGDDCDDNNFDIHQSFNFYADMDGDGYGDGWPIDRCARNANTPPAGYVLMSNGIDCDDNNPTVHQSFLFYIDTDGDGYGSGDAISLCATDANTPPPGYSINNTDNCPDTSNPDQADVNNNGVGDVCDQTLIINSSLFPFTCPDATFGLQYLASGTYGSENIFTAQLSDATGEFSSPLVVGTITATSSGSISVYLPADLPAGPGYRIRLVSSSPVVVSPSIGNLEIRQRVNYYRDADGDGFGSSTVQFQNCVDVPGYVTNNNDCNDADAAIHPGAAEICNGIDDDCDGLIDEGCPANLPRITIAAVSTTEGNAGTKEIKFVVRLSATYTSAIQVKYNTIDSTTIEGDDYVKNIGTLNIAAGRITDTIRVLLNGDARVEPDEHFIVQLSNPINARITTGRAIGTIRNDDTYPALTITNYSITEGNISDTTLLVKLRLSKRYPDIVTINYSTQDSTATAGIDYLFASGTATFNPGDTLAYIPVKIKADRIDEPNEIININLSNIVNATAAANLRGRVTINDDDVLPQLIFVNTSITEGNTETFSNLNFTARLNRSYPVPVSIAYTTQDSTATSGSDYQSVSGTITFEPGDTLETITIPIYGDRVVESNEIIKLQFSNAMNATVSATPFRITITNDDALPQVVFANTSIAEGNNDQFNLQNFTVRLNKSYPLPVTVNYSTQDSSATTGSDYQSVSGTITFVPGDTLETISIPVFGDRIVETAEIIKVVFSNAANATVSATPYRITLTNDDSYPAITITNVSITEGDAGFVNAAFAVRINKQYPQAVSVQFITQDVTTIAGFDYTAASGTVTFPADGDLLQVITIPVAGDLLDEANETFKLQLSIPLNATISGTGSATATITDNDPVPAIRIYDSTATETSGNAVLRIALSSVSGRQVSMVYRTQEGSALDTLDYVRIAGDTLTFQPGETQKFINVAVLPDAITEGNETFSVILAAPVNGTVTTSQGGDNTAVVTIQNSTGSGSRTMNGLIVQNKNGEPVSDQLKVVTAPNPFQGRTQFTVTSPESGELKIIVYDVEGRKVSEMKRDVIKGMSVTIPYQNNQVRQGILLYKVFINRKSATGKLIQIE